jgi:hypothetical protein
MKPYAVCLLERFRAGETASELSAREGIPLGRIQLRLKAAIRLEQMRMTKTNAWTTGRAA